MSLKVISDLLCLLGGLFFASEEIGQASVPAVANPGAPTADRGGAIFGRANRLGYVPGYLAANLPVAGLHIDAVNDRDGVLPLINLLTGTKVLSLGVINGRSIWKTDLNAVLDWLEPIAQRLPTLF